MTDFVIAAVQDAAERAVEQSEVLRRTISDQQAFAEALLSPPKPSSALMRALAKRRKPLRSE